MYRLKIIDRILLDLNNFSNKLAATTGSKIALQQRLKVSNIEQGLLSSISNIPGKLVYNSLETKLFQLKCERRDLSCRCNY